MLQQPKSPALIWVIIAFAIVYVVWGSTYFFIQMAIQDFPPFVLGAFRFILAGFLMFIWCIFSGEKVFNLQIIKHAAVSGILLLLVGNGVVIWAEQTQPSALVAILVSGAPIWFIVLDKANWKSNFSSKSTIIGLFIGFVGVILLFYEKANSLLHEGSSGTSTELGALALLIVGSISWSAGSLYAKHHSNSGASSSVNTAWQMLIAGIAFLPFSFLSGEWQDFEWHQISANSWLAALYLVIFGSLAAFSAYVWLLKVRPATQVSTYAYVNPVVAVLLGVFFANEKISWIQYAGLAIILTSVLLINLAKYRKKSIKETPGLTSLKTT